MTILLAPLATKAAEEVTPQLYRKQILKAGELAYKGRVLRFDKQYFSNLADAFRRQAYDSVPFMLADKDNRHTMEPERASGEIVSLIPTEQGLDAVMRLSTTAAKIVQENPKFGVSARIVEDLQRGDGFRAPAAIQHVLGTWDPRVTGLSPWSAVEMSIEDDDQEVIDLSNDEREEAVSGLKLTTEQEDRLARLLALPDDQFSKLVTAPPEGETYGLTDEEAQRILDELPDEDETPEGEGDKEEAKTEAKLSNETVELSALREQVAATTRELAATKWQAERRELLEAGVPAAMLNLAEPVLTAPESSIELSNGSKLDAKGVVRKLLAEASGIVDMSHERGHGGEAGDDKDTVDLHKLADAAGWDGGVL